jgi:outer membrane protein
MTKFWTVLAASAALVSVPAFAQPSDAQGKIQIKLLGTAVLPDGKITDVRTDLLGLPPTAQTKASDSFVPTIAAEYFLTPQFSIETICCVTPHEVQGAGPIAGTKLVKNAVILPATVTLKYHLETGAGFKPYIGAGPS